MSPPENTLVDRQPGLPGKRLRGMRSRRVGFALIAVVVSVVMACSGSGPVGVAMAAVPRASADPADAALAAAAIDAFGFELLQAATKGDENAVLSPTSIVIALAMARPGARGETAAQIDHVLRSVATDEHAPWLNALDAALAARSGTFKDNGGKDATVALRIANAPFAQRDFAWNQDYLAALASRFSAGVRLVDYRQAAEAARQGINAWVDEQTERRIPELLEVGTIDSLTRLVLVNAIYLKAAWLTPFEESATTSAPFTLLDGSTIDVATMHASMELRYAAGDGWQAVELPYVGGSLAMTVIVPDDLATFQVASDGDAFAAITGALSDHEVDLWLPKFGIETKADLLDVLAAMGMPDAFDPGRADFSGMTTEEALFITAVIHQANIDVDEKGTEAAAATAVVMGLRSAPGERVTLRVDKPFLFALRDVPTGSILFLGRVVEPRRVP
jgi:serpin B